MGFLILFLMSNVQELNRKILRKEESHERLQRKSTERNIKEHIVVMLQGCLTLFFFPHELEFGKEKARSSVCGFRSSEYGPMIKKKGEKSTMNEYADTFISVVTFCARL